MNAPQNLVIPELYSGSAAIIMWDSVPGAAGYVLQRILDSTFAGVNTGLHWNQIEADYSDWDVFEQTWNSIETSSEHNLYDGPESTYTDYIPIAGFVYYRVLAYDSQGQSEWTTSPEQIIINEQPPVISGQDGSLGAKYEPFPIAFVVTDSNPENTVEVTVRLDGIILHEYPEIELGVEYSVLIEEVSFLPEPESHTFTITATDSTGLSAVRTYTFFTVEDLISSAVFYVLRDGVPVAQLTSEREWTDYLDVGAHTYIIRAVDRFDNYADSNSVTITVDLKQPALAPADNPGDIFAPYVRRGERPANNHTVAPQGQSIYFEGQRFPLMVNMGQVSEGVDIAYTHLSRDDMQRLSSLVGVLLIYRDQYNKKLFGYLTNIDDSAIWRNLAHFDAVIDYTAQVTRVEHEEAIEYV